MRGRLLATVVVVLAGLGTPYPRRLTGQVAAPLPVGSASDREIEEALRAARAAQRRFEIERSRRLPVSGWGAGGRCDEVLGRMCLWHDEGDDWYPGPEDPRIESARDELLRSLADAGAQAPGDGWLLGQRVAYLGEAGRWEEADSVAKAACAAGEGDGWCRALEGLALHALGRFPDAERAFRAALDRMGPGTARAWTDPELLLDASGRDWWRDASAAERSPRAVLVWALADPLLLVPGNDRLTEHWARRTLAHVRAAAPNPYGMSWGSDLEQMMVRYGWEVGWERGRPPSVYAIARGEVIGHHDPESRPLMPPGAVLRDPAGADAGAWQPDFRRPRATYAPGYAPILLPGPSQLAVFPRGDRFVLVGAHTPPDDTTRHAGHGHPGRDQVLGPWRDHPAEAGLFLIPVEGDPSRPRTARSTRREAGALLLEAPVGRWVASLEVLTPALRRAGRTRVGVDVPARAVDLPTLSDLLLVEPEVPDRSSLEEVAARALPRSWVGRGERVAIAWELFGLGYRSETLSYQLAFERPAPGLLRRAGRALGLFGPPRSQRLEWSEPGPERPGPFLRTVELDLPELEPGLWIVRLEVSVPGRSPLAREHSIEIRP